MSVAAFIGVVLIHLAAVASPGPSFVVAIPTAAQEGVRTAAYTVGCSTPPSPDLAAYGLGFITFMSNPKTAVFFGAVFVGLVPESAHTAVLGLLLYFIFLNQTCWYFRVGRLFSTQRARASFTRVKRGIDRLFGGLIALLGLKIATS